MAWMLIVKWVQTDFSYHIFAGGHSLSYNLYPSLWFRIKDAVKQRWLHQPLQYWYLLKLGLKVVVNMFCFF